MQRYHWIILYILWSSLPDQSMAQGMGDWTEVTRLGTRMENGHIYLKKGTQLDHVNQWYFYKDHIIGKANEYFIINEWSNVLQLFQKEEDWQAAIDQQHLRPKLWTRWYMYEWHFFSDNLLFALILAFPLTLTLLGLFLWNLYRVIWKENFNIRKPSTIVLVLILFLMSIRYVLDCYPASL